MKAHISIFFKILATVSLISAFVDLYFFIAKKQNSNFLPETDSNLILIVFFLFLILGISLLLISVIVKRLFMLEIKNDDLEEISLQQEQSLNALKLQINGIKVRLTDLEEQKNSSPKKKNEA